MAKTIWMIGAAVVLLMAGVVLADMLGAAPAAFGCAAGDLSEPRYCGRPDAP